MAGGCIVHRVDENRTYDYLHSSEDNLWSTLYLTGYLTKAREEDYKGELPDGMVALMIPNAEIKEIFETTVKKWFEDNAKTIDRKELFDAVWTGNADILTKEIGTLLRMTISFHDFKEDFYLFSRCFQRTLCKKWFSTSSSDQFFIHQLYKIPDISFSLSNGIFISVLIISRKESCNTAACI